MSIIFKTHEEFHHGKHALMNEAVVEHASAKDLNVPIKAMDADDEMFDAKVTVLGYIDHHVKEEHKQVLMAGKR